MSDGALRSPDLHHLGPNDHCLIDVASISPGPLRPFPPKCLDLTLGWEDPNNVRLPSSSCASDKVYQQLQKLIEPQKTIQDVTKAIDSYQTKPLLFDYLYELFDRDLEPGRAQHYLQSTIPKMARLALRLPELITQPIPRLLAGSSGSVTLSQEQVACLLANAFFCTFPAPAFNLGWRKTYFNFERLYMKGRQCKMEKIKCLLHYFDTVLTKMPNGVLSIRRHKLDEVVDFQSTCEPLCDLVIHEEGRIEDVENMIEIDFANRYIGGGVLNAGCVQEEIKFVLCPELLVSLLICERMESHEAISIIGAQRFTDYSGYGDGFKFVEREPSPGGQRDHFNRLLSETVAINATKFIQPALQYEDIPMLRELTKAYAGFDHLDQANRPIATGNWGCGVYKGDRQLKGLIQLIAASILKRSQVHYFTFNDGEFAAKYKEIYEKLIEKDVRTGVLLTYLLNYKDHQDEGDVFGHVERCVS